MNAPHREGVHWAHRDYPHTIPSPLLSTVQPPQTQADFPAVFLHICHGQSPPHTGPSRPLFKQLQCRLCNDFSPLHGLQYPWQYKIARPKFEPEETKHWLFKTACSVENQSKSASKTERVTKTNTLDQNLHLWCSWISPVTVFHNLKTILKIFTESVIVCTHHCFPCEMATFNIFFFTKLVLPTMNNLYWQQLLVRSSI